MKIGDKFRIRTEWCDTPSEHNLVYICCDYNPVTETIYGKTFDTNLTIIPIETFEPRMIEGV